MEMHLQVNLIVRSLTPFEQLVCEHLCDGLTNAAIARTISHTEKVIENTVSRVAQAFNLRSNTEINLRVSLALAYWTHFGDLALDKLNVSCKHLQALSDGSRHSM